MKKKGLREKAVCPDCGCGLIDGMAPDSWREKQEQMERGESIEVTCPGCGKVHAIKEIPADEEA